MESVLKVALIGGEVYDPLYKMIPRFEEETGYTVDVAFTGDHEALNRHIFSRYEAGQGDYDLISTHTKYSPAQSSYLLPLDHWFPVEEKQVFSNRILELCEINGELKQIPRNIDVRLLFYRKDLLDQPPETWDELLQSVKKFRHHDCFGFTFPGRYSGLFGNFFELFESFGGKLFARMDGIDREAAEWAIAYLKELYQSGAVPPETPDIYFDEVSRLFREGRTVLTTDWPGYWSKYQDSVKAAPDCFDISLLPRGPSGKRKAYAGSHSFAIPNSTSDLNGSLKLLKFLTGEHVQRIDADYGHIPARRSLFKEAYEGSRSNPLETKRWQLLEETINEHLIVPPKLPEYPQIEDVLWTTIQQAYLGQLSVPRAVEAINERIASILSEKEAGV